MINSLNQYISIVHERFDGNVEKCVEKIKGKYEKEIDSLKKEKSYLLGKSFYIQLEIAVMTTFKITEALFNWARYLYLSLIYISRYHY